jgi:hypothetical protein
MSQCNASSDNGSGSNSGGDSPTQEALKVFCLQPDWGTTCSQKCFSKGIPCAFGAEHPYKPTAGIGLLFSCNTFFPVGFMCGYQYDNGDACYFPWLKRVRLHSLSNEI